MRRAQLVLLILAAAGCSPDDNSPSVIACGPNGECPAGYGCDSASGLCLQSGLLGRADAPTVPPPPDAVVGGGLDAPATPPDAATITPDAAPAAADAVPATPDAIVTPGPDAAPTLDTHIDSQPPDFTNVASVVIAFSGTPADPGLTFDCTLDGTDLGPCTSPFSQSLADGPHTFTVQAVLGADVDPTPASATFTVDTQPPDTTILGGPDDPSLSSEATFTFASSEPDGATFFCSRDGGATYAACASGDNFAGFSLGAQEFLVYAVDRAGNPDPTPASWRWTVTGLTPDTLFTMVPPTPTRSTDATFVFVSDPVGATFTCRLDGAPLATPPCVSPLTLGGVAPGAHTLAVTAVLAGVSDPTPAQASWTVDTTAPTTTIDSGPSDGALLNVSTVAFTYSSSEPAVFQCGLGGASDTCPAAGVTFMNLTDGSYGFSVHAVDAAGNVGDAVGRSFTIDTQPPSLTLTAPQPGDVTGPAGNVTFTVGGDAVSISCTIDGAATVPACDASGTVPFSGLAGTTHTFSVTATDAAGNPATRSVTWTVDAAGPPVTVATPSDPIGTAGKSCASGQVTFVVDVADDPQMGNPSYPDADAAFDCELDGPSGVVSTTPSCTSPFAFGPLAPGDYTLKVTARDRYQNPGAIGSAAWTVVTPRTAVSIQSPAASSTTAGSGMISDTLDPGAILTSCTVQPGAVDCLPTMKWSELSDGQNPHSVTLVAKDECGLSSQASVSWNVDSTAPVVQFNHLASDQGLPGGSLTYARTDDATTFSCTIDGQGASCGSGGLSYSLHSLGSHTVTVFGTDAVGNVGPTDTYTFTAGIFINTCGAAQNDDCAARIFVPGGPFIRDNATSTPAAHQTMRDFYLDKYEVTNARWNVFVAVNSPRPNAGDGHHFDASGQPDLSSGWDPTWNSKPLADSQGRAGGGPGNQPVAWVTWYGAFAFCAFSGGYLPYEGEWDYAASGGSDNRTYPWGNTPVPSRTLANFSCNAEIPSSLDCGIAAGLLTVGSEPAGAGKWGQMDLAGSIDELVLDRLDDAMVVFPWDNSGVMLPADDNNNRVIKGGNFAFHYSYNDRDGLKTFAVGTGWGVRAVGDTVGFRCAYHQ